MAILNAGPNYAVHLSLIDSNIPPSKIDLEFVNSLGEMQVPFVIAFTKTDRIGKPTLEKNIADFLGKTF